MSYQESEKDLLSSLAKDLRQFAVNIDPDNSSAFYRQRFEFSTY